MKPLNKPVSDPLLNAFVDNQLQSPKSDQVIDALHRNPTLKIRLCELRDLKAAVRHTYRDVAVPADRAAETRRRRFVALRALAAGLILVIGAAAGWSVRAWTDTGLARTFQVTQLANLIHGPARIILHIDSSRPAKLKAGLAETEKLLNTYKRAHRAVLMEVIANRGGLDLLRADTSPYARQIESLRRRYNNVTFLACHQTIERLTEEGVDVKLLPGTTIAPSALDEIVRRVQQGWIYIKI
ncbi:MAG: hypothetical protein KGJ12_08610 [Gammaproteobacteria bacterium]|nr:hypothetical protein [Gammaproteobacteria bacterium]